jgi:hypothetical protein
MSAKPKDAYCVPIFALRRPFVELQVSNKFMIVGC